MLLTLTPNRRLANFLESSYAAQQIKEKKSSWLQPDFKPLMSWVAELFEEINIISPSPSTVLNKVQQQMIVEQIILDLPHQLLNVSNTAMEVVNAFEIMELWRQDLYTLKKYASTYADTAKFIEWASLLKEKMQASSFITQASMLLIVSENLHLINELPGQITFYAFDEINPLQQYFLQKLKELNVAVVFEAGQDWSPQINKVECIDTEDEYIQASKWALKELQNNPDIQLAVIIPNLTQDRKLVVDLFSAIIPNEKLNISAPVSIKKYTMIELVFLIFKICSNKFKYEDLLLLIKNPYISFNIERIEEHAQFIYSLRENVEYYTDLPTIVAYGDSNLPLVKKMNLLLQYLPKISGKKHAREWIADINGILEIFEWPKVKDLNITEQHLMSCFADILEQYLFLDHLKPKHTFNQAIEYLHNLCENVPFLPVDSGCVQIHILGLLEGVGLQFDKIWVANMSREQWPQEPKPNPFIPQVFQYQCNMPHSSANRELEIAINLTKRLMVSAEKHLIFSYAILQDGMHASCSSLIKDFPLLVLEQESFDNTDYIDIFEKVNEVNVTNILKNTAISTQILKYQAECSFKAFAQYSLSLKEEASPEIFLNSSERGRILHQALANFWNNHRSHNNLLQLHKNSELYSEVQKNCIQVMNFWKIKKPYTLSEEYLESETERLIKLVYSWLLNEVNREPFKVVGVEQRHTLLINSLTINCQIDRIDEVEGGAKIIIDYKTGQVVLDHMVSLPLLAPQLPIYALTQNNADLVAVVYAIVKPNDLRFVGLGIEKNYLFGAQAANLTDMVYLWQNELHRLADRFINQPVIVNPISQQACTYCNFQSLCRIYDFAK